MLFIIIVETEVDMERVLVEAVGYKYYLSEKRPDMRPLKECRFTS